MAFSSSWIYRIVDQFSGPARRIVKAGRAIDKSFNKLQFRAGLALGTIANRARRATINFESLGRRVDLATRQFRDFGFAATGIGVALGLVSRFAFKAASTLETAEITFQTLTGSIEKGTQLYKEMINFVKATPFDVGPVAKAQKVLLAFGTPVEKVQEQVRIMGDIAAGTGQPIGDLALVLGQVQSTGKLLAQDANQFAQRGIGLYKEIADAIGATVGQVRKLGEKGLISSDIVIQVLKRMTGEGGRFFKAMERAAKTLDGLFNRVRGAIGIAVGEITLAALKTIDLNKIVTGLIKTVDGISKSMTKWIEQNPELTRQILQIGAAAVVFTALAVVLGVIALAIGALLSPIGLVVAAFVGLGSLFTDALIRLENWREAVVDVGKTIWDALSLPLKGLLFLVDKLFGTDSVGNFERKLLSLQRSTAGALGFGNEFEAISPQNTGSLQGQIDVNIKAPEGVVDSIESKSKGNIRLRTGAAMTVLF